jgi:hypothetical protein
MPNYFFVRTGVVRVYMFIEKKILKEKNTQGNLHKPATPYLFSFVLAFVLKGIVSRKFAMLLLVPLES